MVAIMMAAIPGAGLSMLFLPQFGVLFVILAVPFAGSVAGMADALGLAAARERYRQRQLAGTSPTARSLTVVR